MTKSELMAAHKEELERLCEEHEKAAAPLEKELDEARGKVEDLEGKLFDQDELEPLLQELVNAYEEITTCCSPISVTARLRASRLIREVRTFLV